jgi:hypothetical protein
MWNGKLASQASEYTSAVLTWVEPSGYPVSIRVVPQLDASREVVTFTGMHPEAFPARGKACLLFHRHNEHLEGLHQMVLKGELTHEDGSIVLRVSDFVTANGRTDTDAMPHAGRPLHMVQFLMLGRRKAAEYMKKRGAPWPPIPFDYIERKINEQD